MIKLNQLSDLHKTAGYDTIYLTDNNNLYAAYKFFKHDKSDLKKVIGINANILHMGKKTSLLLYAKNEEGFQNLIVISSLINLSKDLFIEFSDLIKYTDDIICVSPGFDSDIDMAILRQDNELAITIIADYKQSIKDFYIGLSLQTLKAEVMVAPVLKNLAEGVGCGLLPIHKTNYLKPEKEAYDALIKNRKIQRMSVLMMLI